MEKKFVGRNLFLEGFKKKNKLTKKKCTSRPKPIAIGNTPRERGHECDPA